MLVLHNGGKKDDRSSDRLKLLELGGTCNQVYKNTFLIDNNDSDLLIKCCFMKTVNLKRSSK